MPLSSPECMQIGVALSGLVLPIAYVALIGAMSCTNSVITLKIKPNSKPRRNPCPRWLLCNYVLLRGFS